MGSNEIAFHSVFYFQNHYKCLYRNHRPINEWEKTLCIYYKKRIGENQRQRNMKDKMEESRLTEQKNTFHLTDELAQMLEAMSAELSEAPRDVLIAAIEHFSKIPEQQRKAAMKAAARRRRG
jgi:hypothetical protein